MAQTLKSEIKKRIENAALETFSEKGFRDATMIMIAKRAGVSVGNLYRYHPDKKELFARLFPPEFVREFERLIDAKMRAAGGTSLERVREIPLMNIRDAAMLDFLAKHRLRIIVLLDKNSHTRYSRFDERLVERIMSNVSEYLKSMPPARSVKLTTEKRELLKLIYSNLLHALACILKTHAYAEEIAASYGLLLDYHLAGVSRLLN